MRKKSFYPMMALQNIVKNRRFFVPYLLTITGTSAAFYIMCALCTDPGAQELEGYEYVQSMMMLGMIVATLFTAGILFYTNGFLMKQRKRELGLSNILGMGKAHIGLILCFESLLVGLGGLLSGLFLGLLFHRLVTLLLYRMLRFAVPFGVTASLPAFCLTAAVFAVMVFATLLVNLFRVQVSNPMELLRGGNVGEREPKTRWLLTALGVLTLGAGYYIAITVEDPILALALYFVAVILVIIGTFCLFTAVSVFVLKALRKNKGFYYRTRHFIGISGMLYRMKRNAVGLANICILSTMVMVMVSGTLSLYLGTGEIIEAQMAADVNIEVRCDPLDPEQGALTSDLIIAESIKAIEAQGLSVTSSRDIRYVYAVTESKADGFLFSHPDRGERRALYILTAADYAVLTGNPAPALGRGEAALCGGGTDLETVVLHGSGSAITLRIAARLESVPLFRKTADMYIPLCFVVSDDEALMDIYALQRATYAKPYNLRWFGLIDLSESAGDAEASLIEDAFWGPEGLLAPDTPRDFSGYESLSVSLKARAERDGYAMAGGFLFLGIVLGVIFLMATVLIIYYKQISEGYEDRERFEIMQKVGLTKAEVKASIRSQVLMVFFLPIAVAAVHILFDFNMVVKLLQLFSLRNVPLTAICTLDTVLVFFIVYGIVYLLTARTYYKIVS